MITAENLGKSFPLGGWFHRRALHAVRDVSLAVARGETLGLVGESGSGKSTVGRLMLGLLPATTGRVLFEGQDLRAATGTQMRTLRRRLQLVFQDPYASLDPRRTVGAQIADALVIHDLLTPAARPARVADLLHQVGLAPAHVALSAPVLGRPAPAHRNCPGAGLGAEFPGRR